MSALVHASVVSKVNHWNLKPLLFPYPAVTQRTPESCYTRRYLPCCVPLRPCFLDEPPVSPAPPAPPQNSECYRDTPVPRARLLECVSKKLTSIANCRPDRNETDIDQTTGLPKPTVLEICKFDDALVRVWNYDSETPNRRLWCDAVVRHLNQTLNSEDHCKECSCYDASEQCYGFSKSCLLRTAQMCC